MKNVTFMPNPKALTPVEAAAVLCISSKTLLKMAAAGQVPCFRAGRLWRFPAAALERWLDRHEASYQQAA